jgi:hypothetical protein
MDNIVSPPINTSEKCSYLFPYFSNLETLIAGEQTVNNEIIVEGQYSDHGDSFGLPAKPNQYHTVYFT